MPAVRRLPVVADLTLVTAGAMTANVAGYLLQMLASRWLGVTGYSEFASLLAVQLLCAVPALALQNVVARELVRGAGVAALRGLQWRCAVIVAAVAAALVPLVTAVLNVGVVACAAALGAAPALVLLSGEQGILQGSRRFRALAVVLGAAGIARVAPALIVLALGGGAAPALWAAALGIVAAAAFARYTAGSPIPASARHTTRQSSHRQMTAQMMVVSESKARDPGVRVYLRAGRRGCVRSGVPVMRLTGVRGLLGYCRCCGPRRCRRR